MRPGCKPWTADEVEHLRRLAAEMKTPMQIAEVLGRTRRSVEAKMHNLSLMPNQRAGHRELDLARRHIPARARHSSLTAALFGDPLPGRSALDQKRAPA